MSSASAFSLIEVKPTRSQKSVVTTLRSSGAGSGAASAPPHLGQKTKSSGASKPQPAQAIIALALRTA